MSDTITPEKLRVTSADWSLGPGELRNALDDAADRIETLETALGFANAEIRKYFLRAEKSETNNAKLLAALEWLCVDAKITGLDQQAGWDCAFIAARAAIAAAKGGGK